MILFVGDTSENLAIEAKKFDPDAVLILPENLNEVRKINTGYISVGDHNMDNFIRALAEADELSYVNSNDWTDDSSRIITETWLRYFSHRKPCFGIELHSPDQLPLRDARKTDSKQLWAVGCSFTSAEGVSDDKRWPALLANKLNLPLSVLAQGGSSVAWQANQILRSDIRKGDTVVWGITGTARFRYRENSSTVSHLGSNFWKGEATDFINKKLLVTDHWVWIAMEDIEAVLAHQRIIGYDLILTQFPINLQQHEQLMLLYLSGSKFFTHIYKHSDGYNFLDLGTDNQHPGPKQHESYADHFYNFYLERKL